MNIYKKTIPDIQDIIDEYTGEKYYYDMCMKELIKEYDKIIYKHTYSVSINNVWDLKDECMYELRCLHL